VLVKSNEELATTDMPEHVLELLAKHPVTEVHIVGRRGPAQGAFTTKELRELGELDDVDVVVEPRDLELGDADLAEIAANRLIARNVDILREWSTRPLKGAPRRIYVHFWLRPTEISGVDHVRSVRFERFARVADGSLQSTDEFFDIDAQLVVKSVGYFGQPLPGVPFDEKSGTIPNDGGRVSMPDGSGGVYVAGWIKRGPSGIIGTNKKDSIATVEALIADVTDGRANHPTKPHSVEALLAERGVATVDVSGWRKIDAAERALGASKGRERTTIHERSDLLDAAQ